MSTYQPTLLDGFANTASSRLQKQLDTATAVLTAELQAQKTAAAEAAKATSSNPPVLPPTPDGKTTESKDKKGISPIILIGGAGLLIAAFFLFNKEKAV